MPAAGAKPVVSDWLKQGRGGKQPRAILGMSLQTAQTCGHGYKVSKVLVEQGQNISKEFYLSILPDRATATLIIICLHGRRDEY